MKTALQLGPPTSVFSSFFYHCVYFAHNHTVLQGYDTEVERLDISYMSAAMPHVFPLLYGDHKF